MTGLPASEPRVAGVWIIVDQMAQVGHMDSQERQDASGATGCEV